MSKTKQSKLTTQICPYGHRIRNRTGRCFCPHCVGDDTFTAPPADRESFDPKRLGTTFYDAPRVASVPLLTNNDFNTLVKELNS